MPHEDAAKPRELRIAVAMRGGVSLAVWMGGACSEIVRLRDAAPGDDDPYAKLLELLGYDEVTVDVISGTSAGGLNGALLALHLAYGMPFGDGIRDLWLRLGDLESLSRGPSAPHPDSLLIGDEGGFYSRLRDACRELLTRTEPGHRPAEHIRLVLTATRLWPRPVRVPQTLGDPLSANQARAYFRFQHRAGDGGTPVVSDFVLDHRTAQDVANRLSYAARTTSSFPGAFPPARIWVADGDTPPQGRDFRGLSSETGAGDQGGPTVDLIDGGVLDNIPIAWAIRAIAGAPASRPVDRWLVYLQPVEPQMPTPDGPVQPPPRVRPERHRRVTRLLRLLAATLSRRMDSESVLDDAEELHTAAATARLVRGIAAAGIPSHPEEVLDDPRRLRAYRKLVGLSEGARLARLIEDPTSILGPDPLPLPPHRPPLGPRVVAGLGQVDQVTDLATGDRIPEGIRTPLALARTVSLLLDWVRASEACGQLPREAAGPVRDKLYSARLAVELLVGYRDRMLLPHLDNVTSTSQLVDLVRRVTWRLAAAVDPDWRLPDAATWPVWYQQLTRVAQQPPVDDAEGWPDELFAAFWNELAVVGVEIGTALDPDVDGPPGFDVFRAAALHPGTATAAPPTDGAPGGAVTAAIGPADMMRRALTAAELLLGPVRTDPFTEPTDVKLHAITASRANPAEKLIFGEPLQPADRARLKLSGNQLNNFAAFLSARWRHTDWTWGRLDAVPSLVELMVADRTRLATRFAALDDEAVLDLLRSLYLSGGPSDSLRRRWDDLAVEPGDARDRFVDVVIDRLQQGVLAEELPVLDRLASRGADADLPPRQEDLRDLPPADLADAPKIRDVGAETVRNLLRRGHVRRTATRAGLVAWRAVQPAGTGVFAWIARLLFGLVKPVLLTPVLAAVASPLGATLAALGAWLLVAAVAGTWSSPLFLPVLAAGFALLGGLVAWRLFGARGWGVALGAVSAALVYLAASVGLHLAGIDWLWQSDLRRYPSIMLGALVAVAPFLWLRASRTAGTVLLGVMILLLLLAGVLGVVLSQVAETSPASGWLSDPLMALLTLYAVLVVPTVLLTWRFPGPPGGDRT